eukprot:gnl/MRDRNA2_/MRDRNA2_210485_c0_seq1.p1 gnl/MRDRNA2_/MRDRNA2_210485_c0~~gnl/MRDRNA2_/MRDRNA2_210485_c0_seq1.p1  ORF type:complete len:263 (+),score=49.44 gnl/MRDRNA2_/MRDRNA2_210485_c0_seq1:151-939(+)
MKAGSFFELLEDLGLTLLGMVSASEALRLFCVASAWRSLTRSISPAQLASVRGLPAEVLSWRHLAHAESGGDWLVALPSAEGMPAQVSVWDPDAQWQNATSGAAVAAIHGSLAYEQEHWVCWQVKVVHRSGGVMLGIVPAKVTESAWKTLPACLFQARRPMYPPPRVGWGLLSDGLLLSSTTAKYTGARISNGDEVVVMLGKVDGHAIVQWAINGVLLQHDGDNLPADEKFVFAATLWGNGTCIEWRGGSGVHAQAVMENMS